MSAVPKRIAEAEALPEARRLSEQIFDLTQDLWCLTRSGLPTTGDVDKDDEFVAALVALEDAQDVIERYLEQLQEVAP